MARNLCTTTPLLREVAIFFYQSTLTLIEAPPGMGELRVEEGGEEEVEGGVEGAEEGVEGRERERRKGGRPRGFEGQEGL
jgi:hypothetical protein